MFSFTVNTSALEIDDISSGLLEYIHDMRTNSNVIYNVYTEDSVDVTDLFNLATNSMSDIQVREYVKENNLIMVKYYISDISPLMEGGTETFRQYVGSYTKDRNNMFEIEFQYVVVGTVTWDSNYGIYSGSHYIDTSSIDCSATYFSYQNLQTPSPTISSNRRTISYPSSMTIVVYYDEDGFWQNGIYFDTPTLYANWSW